MNIRKVEIKFLAKYLFIVCLGLFQFCKVSASEPQIGEKKCVIERVSPALVGMDSIKLKE
jgi:hypothetical protein